MQICYILYRAYIPLQLLRLLLNAVVNLKFKKWLT